MKIIIIGGIAAGMSAAAKAKRMCKDAEITVYEKSPYISFGACGLPYYAGDFFEDKNQMFARTVNQMEASGIKIYTNHEVIKVNSESKSIEIKNLDNAVTFNDTYDKLMIATGATAIIPPIKNLNLDNVHTLRSLNDGDILREKLKDRNLKKVGIIGAGFIGLEIAEAAKKYNKEISIFQLEDSILKGTFDKEITDILESELKNENINLYLNTKVTELIGEKKVSGIKAVTSNNDTINVEIDLLIISTGVRPNTKFLEKEGLEMLPNGAIIVNNKGETSIEDIYAAGDCAAMPHLLKDKSVYIPLATSANKLGRIVGENLSGGNSEFEGTLGSSCLKVLNIEAGRTGLSESEAKAENINYKTVFIKDKNQTNYYPDQQDIYIKLVYDADSKIILGGQVIGRKDAVLRSNIIAAAVYSKMTTSQLGMLDLCYAPPFSRTWDSINIAGNAAK